MPPGPYAAYLPPPGVPGRPGPGATTNGFAIASLIFGLLGGVLFGAVFGFVALRQIRKRGQHGRGLALTGLIASGLWLAMILLVVAAEIKTGGSNGSGTGTGDGTVSITDLKPGDCLTTVTATGTVTDVPVVPCTTPHAGEVFAVFDLPDGPWPGDAKVEEQSESRCNDEFDTYADSPDSKLELYYLHPKEQSWWRDRGVICIATDPSGLRTGSLRK